MIAGIFLLPCVPRSGRPMVFGAVSLQCLLTYDRLVLLNAQKYNN